MHLGTSVPVLEKSQNKLLGTSSTNDETLVVVSDLLTVGKIETGICYLHKGALKGAFWVANSFGTQIKEIC